MLSPLWPCATNKCIFNLWKLRHGKNSSEAVKGLIAFNLRPSRDWRTWTRIECKFLCTICWWNNKIWIRTVLQNECDELRARAAAYRMLTLKGRRGWWLYFFPSPSWLCYPTLSLWNLNTTTLLPPSVQVIRPPPYAIRRHPPHPARCDDMSKSNILSRQG